MSWNKVIALQFVDTLLMYTLSIVANSHYCVDSPLSGSFNDYVMNVGLGLYSLYWSLF